jgi:alpha-tubulin suppressor-like RCC1 family protein
MIKRLVYVTAAAALTWFGVAAPAGATAPADGPTVQGWGEYGTTPGSTSPVQIFGGSVAQVASNNAGTFILNTKGVLFAYGNQHNGALGNGTGVNALSNGPVKVALPSDVTITALATSGAYNTMTAIDTKGHAWGWGDNDHGQLCNGNEAEQDRPIEMPFNDVTAMAGAGSHTLIAAGGHLYSCGQNVNGELGIGSQGRTSYPTPQPVTFEGDNATPVYLDASWHDSGAILSDGSYWAWGFNQYGNVGNGTTTDATSPYKVFSSGVTTATEGGGGNKDGSNMAIKDGTTYVWGGDASGQLCNGTTATSIPTPTAIAGSWSEVAGGGLDSYLLDSSGTMWACGTNREGGLGQGNTNGKSAKPVKVLTGATNITSTAREAAALVP